MLFLGLLILLVFQLCGEVLVMALDAPVPGPVVGMVLLFFVLLIFGRVPEQLRLFSEGLLKHLSLLFVPAGVGLMVHLEYLAEYWLALVLALSVSAFITLLVVAGLLRFLVRSKEGRH
ncbi:CidA/LrgA family protein [Neptunomonas sp. XY-337]|uniref:CidA/LrgA family protein n=1 Tax=Neptunomonas sp. XY-337 TaxID=2561897 RepID=UPI0010AA350A|nr:CidA/LrgA family protein [Neptunomonas sp. XY-337]